MSYEKNGNRNTILRAALAGLIIAGFIITADAALYNPPSSSMAPSGAAGGSLTGSYPNPGIADGSVTLADQVNAAANSFRGNNTGSAATPVDMTVTQARTLLVLTTGTWTPTLTNGANAAASTAIIASYSQSNDIVTCFGQIAIDATTTLTATLLTVTLPVASDIQQLYDVGGTFSSTSENTTGSVSGDATNNAATFKVFPTTVANTNYFFHFSYRIR